MKRKICVVTGTRAEYGLLHGLIKKIEVDNKLELQLIATGMHLSPEYGETYKDIEKDFKITKKIFMDLSSNSAVSNLKAMATLQNNLTDVFYKLKPDIVVVLGDRYEILSVALCALMLQIPIAHIHGGEITYGAIDDSIRHALTKLSYIHFTSTDRYAKRVIQMGEDPSRVFNVGSLGVQNIKKLQLLSKDEFEQSINFKLKKKNLLVTYHPQTLSKLSSSEQMRALLDALGELDESAVIFTKANADTGSTVINSMIDDYVARHRDSAVAFSSLGQLRYFSAIKYVDVVVGNSSSGILEVPSFKKPTVNIGERQKGRLKAKSIIDCKIIKKDIKEAIYMAYDESFLDSLKGLESPYWAKDTDSRIKNILKSISLDSVLQKRFYDLKVCDG
jgi:GDP/UDP-N,N'-diacetylbacillosamine 2-epimerase (hydrolysing)